MNNLAAAIYMTAEGVPFMQAGEEFLRSKVKADGGLDENSYASPDSVNSLKWSNLEDEQYQNVFQYYKGLIAFRKAHPVLRLDNAEDVKAHATPVEDLDDNVVAFAITGDVDGETADGMYVIFNANNEKKEVTPIITPSLGYKLRSINWNEDFYFDNPIDKEKINSIPKDIEISKDIFLAIEKSGMQYRETYKWDEYLYFKMTAENIFAATIYYYCKHYPKEYCNLAYIIATVCNPDISILSEMLKRDRETEIFIRGLNECHTLNVGSEFTGIKNELTTYLGRLYTKEFFYLFTEGKYSPNTSQFILLHYFDNVIWQVEQLQKNGFLFLESNIKKENDEESLYDSYDDGIPIKFLINKGRLDFSKIMYESTEKNETNNIK